MNLSPNLQSLDNPQKDSAQQQQFFQNTSKFKVFKYQVPRMQNISYLDSSLQKLQIMIKVDVAKPEKEEEQYSKERMSEYDSSKQKLTEDLQNQFQREQNNQINYINPQANNSQEMIEQRTSSKKKIKEDKKIQKNIKNIQNSGSSGVYILNTQNGSNRYDLQNALAGQSGIDQTKQQKEQQKQYKQSKIIQSYSNNQQNIDSASLQEKLQFLKIKNVINHKSITVKDMQPYSETLQKNMMNFNIPLSPSTDFNQLENHRKLTNRVINQISILVEDKDIFSSSNQNQSSSLQFCSIKPQYIFQRKPQIPVYSEVHFICVIS